MNREQFYLKVKRMREAQQRYFRTRSAKALADAKKIEQEIDAEIERVESIRAKSVTMGDIFDAEQQ